MIGSRLMVALVPREMPLPCCYLLAVRLSRRDENEEISAAESLQMVRFPRVSRTRHQPVTLIS